MANKFKIDIVANDQASAAIGNVAAQLAAMQQTMQGISRNSGIIGQNFNGAMRPLNANLAQTGNRANQALTPLGKLAKTLKNVSYGLNVLGAPGASAVARLGALTKLASLAQRAPPAASSAATAGAGGLTPLPPSPPSSLPQPAAWGMMGGAAVEAVAGLSIGAVAATLALVKLGSVLTDFTEKYSGKAQDVVYAAGDIGVGTKYLQDMEHLGQMQGLQQGVMTQQLASLGTVVRNARLGQNLEAARAFNLLHIPLGTPESPRELPDIVKDLNKAITTNRNMPQTQILALGQLGLSSQMRRVLALSPSSVSAQITQASQATLPTADLQKLIETQRNKALTDIIGEGAGAYIAGKTSPAASLYEEAKRKVFDTIGRPTFYQGKQPGFPTPQSEADRLSTQGATNWHAPLLYGQKPTQQGAQDGTMPQPPLRLDVHVTTEPGVKANVSTPAAQSNTNTRIFHSGPNAK